MRFATKVTALLVLVSVAPVAASGLISSMLSGGAVERQTRQLQQGLANQTAGHINAWFSRVVADIRRAGRYLPLEQSKGQELSELLRVPFRQLEYVSAIAVIDFTGKAIAPPVYLPAASKIIPSDLRNRPRLTASDLRRLSENVPLAATLKHGVAFGPPYRSESGASRIVCAVSVDRLSRKSVLAAELSLEGVRRILGLNHRFSDRSTLVDGQRKVVLGIAGRKFGASLANLRIFSRPAGPGATYQGSDGQEVLGTLGRVELVGWTVLLEQPLDTALAAVGRLKMYTFVWTALCLVLAIIGGIYLGQGVARPVRELAAAAARMKDEDQTVQVPVRGADEMAHLGQAFNDMSRAVQEQRVELRRWNEELQQRVEQRTREVHDALEQVIRSQKLGALGELSAGFAHELNNPLTGIMGLSQLVVMNLSADDPARENLKQIMELATRISEVSTSLQRFCETRGELQETVDAADVCRATVALSKNAIEEAAIVVELSLADDLPRIQGNSRELEQAMLHLVHNAIRAMPTGGTLSIRAAGVAEAVQIVVGDTGTGIEQSQIGRIFEPFYAPDKTETHRPGLGLSVVDRIVTEHHGQIVVRSEPGRTEFTMTLPGRRRRLHL